MRRAAIVAIGAAALAGCSIPAVQSAPVTPAPVVKTAPESSMISARCRAELAAVDGGPELLNTTDIALAADATGTFGPTQGASDLEAFVYAAHKLGVEAP